MPPAREPPVLTLRALNRALNRALLARQLLHVRFVSARMLLSKLSLRP